MTINDHEAMPSSGTMGCYYPVMIIVSLTLYLKIENRSTSLVKLVFYCFSTTKRIDYLSPHGPAHQGHDDSPRTDSV